MKRLISRLIPATLLIALLPLVLSTQPAAAELLPATLTASSSNGPFGAANAGDGNQNSYWESANNAFPQWIQADLGATATVNRVIMKLPVANWAARTQTLTVQGSTNGTSFSTLVGSAGYTFNPATSSTVQIDFGPASVRYVRLLITANTGWPAGQLSEFEVHGTGGNPQPPGANLALGKPVTASSSVFTFVAANANDNNVATYWEGAPGSYPNTLTVNLGANAALSSVVVRLNPDPAWGRRTQTIEVQGREQSSSAFTTIAGAASYVFDPASGNAVTIPVSATAAEVRLRYTANSGAPAGQAAEFQVFGTPAPNPDLTVTALSWSPASPVETDQITVSATVRNGGTAGSGATSVNLYLGSNLAGTAQLGALAAGAQSTVSTSIGARDAGTYQLTAKVDENNTVIELNEANNSFTGGTPLVVGPVASSDLVAAAVTWSPGNPAAGNAVSFSVAIRNQGSVASASGAHGITVTVLDQGGTAVRTLTGAHNGVIAAGATAAPVTLGTWTAANGRYTVRVVLATDANELPVKQANNTSSRALFVGRGANMPYDMYEAEDGTTGGGASVIGPNRTVGDLAGEASGRRAVTLNSTGAFVEFTTRASTNTLVTRFSIPDSPGGGGTTSTLNIYVNGSFHKAINLTSRYAWLYGAEASPTNSPGAGPPRHIYDEANELLKSTV
ncbi:discoidin domain-containing protein, partial [Actinophytocola sp.]|uniref:discoidin domain-containing protein n=1 Tax=Actinophytocola sp. TaxID=1872138 RepID=UPI002D7F1FEB